MILLYHGKSTKKTIFPRYVQRIRSLLAPFPPLIKTTGSDLVTDMRVTLGLSEIRVCHYLCMERSSGKKKNGARVSSGKGRESCK